jgi:predicted  nucleic acid-binding Zn-ribbon protein
MESLVKEKETKYESIKSIYKSKYKELDKILDIEKERLHDAEKEIKSNTKTESKGDNQIKKEKKKITENEAIITKYETDIKVSLNKEIETQLKFIENLKERSLIYK